MGCLKLNNRGVSEVISTVLVLFIITSSMSFVMLWAIPYMDESKAESQTDNVYSQFFIFDEVLDTLINQGINSSSSSNIMLENGDLYIDSQGSRLVIFYSIDSSYDFNVSGLEYGSEEMIISTSSMTPPDFDIKINVTTLKSGDYNVFSDSNDPYEFNISEASLGFKLSDSIKIDLIDKSHTPDVLFGLIWVFDLGSIQYSLSSRGGEYRIVSENCGILSFYNLGFYLEKRPRNFIYDGTDLCVINIAQIRPGDDYLGAGGEGVFKLEAKNNGSRILPYKTQTCDYIKMRFYGETAQAWSDSLYLWENYKKWTDPEGDILYISGNKTFTIVQNYFNVSIGVI